jgi:hypothetical protein
MGGFCLLRRSQAAICSVFRNTPHRSKAGTLEALAAEGLANAIGRQAHGGD